MKLRDAADVVRDLDKTGPDGSPQTTKQESKHMFVSRSDLETSQNEEIFH